MKNNVSFDNALAQNAFYRFSFGNYKYKVLPVVFPLAAVANFKIKLPADSDLDNAKIKGLGIATNDANDLTNYFQSQGFTVFTLADMAKFTLTIMNGDKVIIENLPLQRLAQSNSGNKFLATDFRFTTFESYLIKTGPGNLASANSVCFLEFLYE
jgi:hypothetical protein